MRAC
jgi:Ca2+-binding EF-hand superfamily protein